MNKKLFIKPKNLSEFLSWLTPILEQDTTISNNTAKDKTNLANHEIFVQISLGKPTQSVSTSSTVSLTASQPNPVKRALLRPVTVKEGERILLVITEARRDLTRTLTVKEALAYIREELGASFQSATVKTLERDLFVEITKSGAFQVGSAKPSVTVAPSRAHDREKQFSLSPQLPWLRDLGVTNAAGEIRSDMRDKFIQIECFANILRPELEKIRADKRHISVVDIGSGKSYLTFALYQLLTNIFPDAKIAVRGIEKRSDLVRLSNEVAQNNNLIGLRFVHSLAEKVLHESIDIVVALHACDTATDDAILLALAGQAKLICVAPCCQKYVRKKMRPTGALQTVTQHGIHAERMGETITDALRALFLETRGYATKVVEFIDKSHTAKNTMILGNYTGAASASAQEQLEKLKTGAGLPDFYLDLPR